MGMVWAALGTHRSYLPPFLILPMVRSFSRGYVDALVMSKWLEK
jgi:hypothetical protein